LEKGAWFGPKVTIGFEISLVTPVGVDQVEERFSLFGDSVNLDTK
jgi:hypothetical protein